MRLFRGELMKKILKVSGIVLAVIFVIMIIGFAVITAFFPGLFVYMNAKKEYPHINDKIGEYSYYDTEVPADFVQAAAGDFYVSGPADAFLEDTESMFIFKSDDKSLVIASYSSDNEPYDFSEDETCQYDESDYIHFFETVKCDVPKTNREVKEFLRNKLDLEMCMHLRGTDKKVYKEYAETKELLCKVEKLYRYERDGIEGYVCEITSDDDKYFWTADFYTGENDEKENVILVRADDIETVKQVFASIEKAD